MTKQEQGFSGDYLASETHALETCQNPRNLAKARLILKSRKFLSHILGFPDVVSSLLWTERQGPGKQRAEGPHDRRVHTTRLQSPSCPWSSPAICHHRGNRTSDTPPLNLAGTERDSRGAVGRSPWDCFSSRPAGNDSGIALGLLHWENTGPEIELGQISALTNFVASAKPLKGSGPWFLWATVNGEPWLHSVPTGAQ